MQLTHCIKLYFRVTVPRAKTSRIDRGHVVMYQEESISCCMTESLVQLNILNLRYRNTILQHHSDNEINQCRPIYRLHVKVR